MQWQNWMSFSTSAICKETAKDGGSIQIRIVLIPALILESDQN